MGSVCPICFLLLIVLLFIRIAVSMFKDSRSIITGCRRSDDIPCILCKKCMKPEYWSSEVYYASDEKEIESIEDNGESR